MTTHYAPRSSLPSAAYPHYADPPAGTTWHVIDTMQAVITALTLAFIFRAFFVEQFIIPTGSMAESLLGAHATQMCPACGWEYDVAPLRDFGNPDGAFEQPPDAVCPNCHLRLIQTAAASAWKAGDRILVSKWPYAVGGPLGPRRWDIVVFRDPASDDQHYIKRLVGLPGESIEILDGNVFVDGRIARKPPRVQAELWFVVFDQGHAPHAAAASGGVPRWIVHDPAPAGAAGWTGLQTRVLRYSATDDTPRRISFNPDAGRGYLQDFYGYNRRSSGVYVGDVRLQAEVSFHSEEAWLELALVHPPERFVARLTQAGVLTLEMEARSAGAAARGLGEVVLPPAQTRRPLRLELGHVDFRVYVAIDGREVLSTTDAAYGPDVESLRAGPGARPVALSLTAAGGTLELRRVRIDRDVHYTQTIHSRRAYPEHPFQLRRREYFVLGDNSPDSHDSREWTEVAPRFGPDTRPGVVPADQIVGQAGFVYLPGLLTPQFVDRLAVPDLGRIRLVR